MLYAYNRKGQYFKIVGKSKRVWGAAFKGQDYYEDEPPLIISIGHKISLDTAIDVVSKSCVKHCPESVILIICVVFYKIIMIID